MSAALQAKPADQPGYDPEMSVEEEWRQLQETGIRLMSAFRHMFADIGLDEDQIRSLRAAAGTMLTRQECLLHYCMTSATFTVVLLLTEAIQDSRWARWS